MRDSAYRRAELGVNEIGPTLFPLITAVEERVIGTLPLVMPAGTVSRARMYELHGVMDVLSSVTVAAAQNNVICDAVQAFVPTCRPVRKSSSTTRVRGVHRQPAHPR